MPQLAANLSTMFREWPFLERFAAAADCGFRHVEYQFPYALGSAAEIGRRARAAGVEVVLHNLSAGDEARGDRGIASLPDRIDEFRAGVAPAIDYALEAGCRQLNCLAGLTRADLPRPVQFDTLVDNLRFAADRLEASGLRLLLEPVAAIPGFFVRTSAEAIAAIDAAARDNLLLQYDLYQMHLAEGELPATLARLMPRIGHLQLADAPGRHEPGTGGELDIPALLAHIDRLGYAGAIGCEYLPLNGTVEGLAWARAWLQPAAQRSAPQHG